MKSIYLARLALIEWLYDLVMAAATALEEARARAWRAWQQEGRRAA